MAQIEETSNYWPRLSRRKSSSRVHESSFLPSFKNAWETTTTKIELSCRPKGQHLQTIQFLSLPAKAKMELSCWRELNFVNFAKNIKRPSCQSLPPLWDWFLTNFGIEFVANLGTKIEPQSITFWICFLITFWTTVWSFVSFFLITWEVKKQCKVDRETTLRKMKKH